jgi:hypothetical protein
MRTFAMRAGLLALACATGCRGDTSTPFDPRAAYQPLEAVRVSFPDPVPDDPHPESVRTAAGAGKPDGAHGAAYLHAPLSAVWDALHDPAVSRIHGPTWALTGTVEAQFPLSFSIDYADGPSLFRVHWTIAYRGGALSGTPEAPVEVGFRYQKVAGTDYIPVQEGSLVASDAGDGATALELVCHLYAEGQGPEDARGTVTDWFDGLRAKVHGKPVP